MPPLRALCLAPLLALPALAGAACSTSSSPPCAAVGTVSVTVTDESVDSNSNFLCTATVTIASSDGGAPRPLTPQGYDGSVAGCIYVTNVGPGSYTLGATAAGYTPLSEPLVVEQVQCVTESTNPRIGLYETQQSSADAGVDVNISVIRDAEGDRVTITGGG